MYKMYTQSDTVYFMQHFEAIYCGHISQCTRVLKICKIYIKIQDIYLNLQLCKKHVKLKKKLKQEKYYNTTININVSARTHTAYVGARTQTAYWHDNANMNKKFVMQNLFQKDKLIQEFCYE
eukprot:TRINITY_DN18255_c0_g1_i10.p6 TRINITY_DN18255_c0_g1~~TRINITY_DN18255_c0_g1_i10.p6  ORF type:complete len:122 (+),score=1.43 TRINITY_DN18255_c0_g1_i10:930-1295(+)